MTLLSFTAFFIPRSFVYPALWGTVSLEFLLGTAPLYHRLRRASLAMTIGLLALFSAALAYAAFRGVNQSCGCGLGQVSPSAAIIRNLVIATVAGAALLVHWYRPPLEGVLSCDSEG